MTRIQSEIISDLPFRTHKAKIEETNPSVTPLQLDICMYMHQCCTSNRKAIDCGATELLDCNSRALFDSHITIWHLS